MYFVVVIYQLLLLFYKFINFDVVKFIVFLAFYKTFIIVNFHLLK